MEIVIRKALTGDFASVKEIMAQVQQLHVEWRPDVYRPNDTLMTEEIFNKLLEGGTLFVADCDGRVAGIMEIMYRHIEHPSQTARNVLYIDTMAVKKEFRGCGIGHLFFEEAKRIKEEKGLDSIELQVLAKNDRAFEMYKKCGFTVKSYFMELTDRTEAAV